MFLLNVQQNVKRPNHSSSIDMSFPFLLLVGLSAPSTSSASCWDPSSFVADSMCRFFTDCSTKRRYECPPNSLFDRNLKQCVPKEYVQCWW
jgi:hypothetical protein